MTDVAELERLAERLEYAGVEVRWDQTAGSAALLRGRRPGEPRGAAAPAG
jgi:hypothetical protein